MASNRRGFIATASLGAFCATMTPVTVARAQTASATRSPTLPALPRGVPPAPTVLRIDPRELGAKGDGVTKDTQAIQQALDRCAVLGGGEVVVSPGTYLIGAIRIGSRTTLRLAEGATLQGSPDKADYPVVQVRWEGRWVPGYIGLVWAQQARDVSITGKGRIVASMAFTRRIEEGTGLRHPCLLEFVDVQGLSVTEVYTEQNAMWSIHPVYCEDVVFRGVTVKGGADGIDVDSCARIVIDHCDFDTVDDCISLKSGRGMEGNVIAKPTEDVTITDCSFRDQHWACIGIGSETSAGIRRVLVERCQCLAARTFAIYLKTRPGRWRSRAPATASYASTSSTAANRTSSRSPAWMASPRCGTSCSSASRSPRRRSWSRRSTSTRTSRWTASSCATSQAAPATASPWPTCAMS
jgi:polygalacturonase